MSNFVHLHAHSTFSFLDGYGRPEQIRERIEELGHDAVAVTDHGTLFGYVPYTKAFKGSGKKVIYGMEAYIVDDVKNRDKTQASLGVDGIPHITILVRNGIGYENLLKLNKFAWDNFYYKPRIDHEMLIEHQEGLIVLSGCPTGYPTRFIGKGMYEQAFNHMGFLSKHIEDYFIEIVPAPGYEPSHKAASYLFQCAESLGRPAVLTADAHFPRPEDHAAQDILLCVSMGKKIDDPERTLKLAPYYYYCSREELIDRGLAVSCNREQLERAADMSVTIADMCEVELPKAKSVAFPGIPENQTSADYLWKEVCKGWDTRRNQNLIPEGVQDYQDYWDRVCHEYQVLRDKGFCDYILAIADVVTWMKDHDCLVVCRGSAGGSALLWVLGVTTLDPIKHGLSFERFYDDNRPDPPDVDIDFESGRRREAIDYVYEKYGSANCSQIASLSELRPKSALQDAAFALGIPRSRFGSLSAALDSRDADVGAQLSNITDPEALQCLHDFPQLQIFEKLIGQYRQSGRHAAGILISSEPIDKIVGTILSDDKMPIATVDKYGAAELGFLKMDFLGVSELDLISSAARHATGRIDWLETLQLDDDAAFAIARDGKLAAIFQLEGGSAAGVVREISVSSFGDVSASSALCRPGAIQQTGVYKRNKESPEEFQRFLNAISPIAQDIILDTYGVVLYQEQVMRFAREMAGFDWPDVHKLRKGITGSLGAEWFAEWKQKFVHGCLTRGFQIQEIEYWWGAIETHGGYSFNRAHAMTYAQIGYWALWLKAHYPAYFYEAALRLEPNDVTKKRLIREFMSVGGQVQLLDHERSEENFTAVSEKLIVGGFSNFKGCGEKMAVKVMAKRPFASFDAMIEALPKAVRVGLQRCYDANGWKTSELIAFAPWFPVMGVEPEMEDLRNSSGCFSPRDLQSTPMETRVAGYVTATDLEKDRLIVVLEDETRAIVARAAARNVSKLTSSMKGIQHGDYVAIGGKWTGEVLFINQVVMLKKRIEI
jgi:DNA polymerase-3 subunit alpha